MSLNSQGFSASPVEHMSIEQDGRWGVGAARCPKLPACQALLSSSLQ